MREPWETLLGGFRGRYCIGEYLDGDTPRIRDLKEDERWWSLSSGEQAMVLCAEAILQINQCWLAVDEHHRRRIELALRIACDA